MSDNKKLSSTEIVLRHKEHVGKQQMLVKKIVDLDDEYTNLARDHFVDLTTADSKVKKHHAENYTSFTSFRLLRKEADKALAEVEKAIQGADTKDVASVDLAEPLLQRVEGLAEHMKNLLCAAAAVDSNNEVFTPPPNTAQADALGAPTKAPDSADKLDGDELKEVQTPFTRLSTKQEPAATVKQEQD